MSAVTPGLVCAHHHLYSALARGMPAPPKVATNFQEILEQVWWRLDTALDLEMIRWSAMLGALEALESGTTAIVDHHESPNAIEGSLDVIADACAEVGVRSLLAYGITDRHGADGARRGLAENERFIRAGGRGLVGIHAAFTCSDGSLAAAAGLAADLGVGVHVHVCEGVGDAGAPRRLAGLTRDDWLLAHCVHLPTDHDLRGTILHNPMSNLNNAVGYANPARFSNPVALGTDGIGGNVLEAFRLAYVLERSVDVTCGPGHGLGLARDRLGPRPGGARRHGHLVVRPDGSLAHRVHARASGRSRSPSAARSCSATAGPPGSTPSRSGPRPANRPPASTHGSRGPSDVRPLPSHLDGAADPLGLHRARPEGLALQHPAVGVLRPAPGPPVPGAGVRRRAGHAVRSRGRSSFADGPEHRRRLARRRPRDRAQDDPDARRARRSTSPASTSPTRATTSSGRRSCASTSHSTSTCGHGSSSTPSTAGSAGRAIPPACCST